MLRPGIDLPAPANLAVRPPVEAASLQDDWRQLAKASQRIFSTYEWASSWWHEYGDGEPPRVHPIRDATGALEGVLPVYVNARGPLRVARFIGHGAGDELGPVCAPESRPTVAAAIRRCLERGQLQADLLLAESMPEVEGWSRLMGGTVLRRAGSPATRFESDSWDDFLARLSSNLRGQIRNRERKLEGRYRVVYRVTSRPDELENDLDTFYRLHELRWGAASSLLQRRAFYSRFAALAMAEGWLHLSFLELDGLPAAASLDFRYAGIHAHYNSGRDPAWERDSVGLVLRTRIMRETLETGIDEYRFLLGDEPYKRRFATEERGSETLALGASRFGRLSVGLASRGARYRLGRQLLARAAGGV